MRNRCLLVTRQQLLILSFKILIKALKYAAEYRYLKAVSQRYVEVFQDQIFKDSENRCSKLQNIKGFN